MTELWAISPHVCRLCFGRLLVRQVAGREQARCAECGEQRDGEIEVLCCCGAKMADGTDAGLRCIPNDNRSPAMPNEIVVVHKSRYPGGRVLRG